MHALEELAESQGDRAAYRSELAEANCLMGAVGANVTDGLQHCRQGVAQARELAAENPSAPAYQDLLARCLRRSGEAHRRSGAIGEALAAFGEAAALRTELSRRFPASPQHVLEGATVRQARAALLRESGDLPMARRELEDAVAAVRAFGSGSDRFLLTLLVLPQLHEDLLAVVEAQGDTAGAAQLRANAPVLPRPPFGRPPPRWR